MIASAILDGMADMIEIMIERWVNRDGSTDHVWSLWENGTRIQIGNRHSDADNAESEALDFCRETLRAEPDRISRL